MFDSKGTTITFRGTLAELLAHQDEIPVDAVIDIRIRTREIVDTKPTLAESLASLLTEADLVEYGEPVVPPAEHAQTMIIMIEEKLKKQGFSA